MVVEFPDDLNTVISKAQGPLTLKAFAEKAGISYSKLHRLVKHEIKRVVDDETLKAIADHADPESGVTFEELERACAFVVESNRSYEDEQKELYARKKKAISALQEHIFNSSVVSSMSKISHPHKADLTDPASGSYFDLSVKVMRDVPEERILNEMKGEESLYFRVITDPLGLDTLDNLYRFIGRIYMRAQPRHNERYYMVVVNDMQKTGNDRKIERIEQFREFCRAMNPAFVVTGEMDEKKVEAEKKILSAVFGKKEDDISIDTRIKDHIINASVVIVTYDEEENPYLTEIVISNEDRILTFDDGSDMDYVFSENFKDDNVWVAPYVRACHDVEKVEENNHEEQGRH